MTLKYHIVPETSVQQFKFYELRKSSKSTPIVSFLCMFTGREVLLEDSLNSVTSIAEELGMDYEIMIVNTTLIPINKQSTEGILTTKQLKIADYGSFTRGEAKNEAMKLCSGSHVVIFDPEKEYNISYADTIFQFVNQKEKAVFFGEFLIIRREVIEEMGGWNKLSIAEDLDLLSRISEVYSILFYVTEGIETLTRFLTYKPSQITMDRRFKNYGFGKKLEMMTDLISGSNYRYSDIHYFWKGKYRLIGDLAYLKARLKRGRSTYSKKSNFTILMESLFESIILNEYQKFEVNGKPMRLSLGPMELKYLENKSDVFVKVKNTLSMLIQKEE